MRRCNKCGGLKPIVDFHKGQYRCKPCGKESNKEYARKRGVRAKRTRDPSLLDSGLKECFQCDQVKALKDFSPAARGYGGVAAYCKPCMVDRRRDAEAAHPDRVKAIRDKYRRSEKWRTQHKGHMNRRRAKKADADTGLVTLKFVRRLYEEEFCHYCWNYIQPEYRTMDHKTPISRGGLHDPSNLVMACVSCNSSKRALTEREFEDRGIRSKGVARQPVPKGGETDDRGSDVPTDHPQ